MSRVGSQRRGLKRKLAAFFGCFVTCYFYIIITDLDILLAHLIPLFYIWVKSSCQYKTATLRQHYVMNVH